MKVNIAKHYDLLIENENDPINDCDELKQYMDKWDGYAFINELGLNKEKSILEIGCGTGRILQKLCGNYKSYTGIDLSLKTISRAKQRFNDSNIKFICGDFLKQKFNDKFDIIYSTLTFMHIKRKKKAINKIYNLINENGKLILSIDKNKNKSIDTGYSKIRIFPDDKSAINKMLKANEFKNINCLETEHAFIFSAIK